MFDKRRGFSLIEVMVAMSICTFGLTVLLQLTWLAQQHADRSSALATQQILCQNRLNEVVAGIRHWENVDQRVCEEDPRYEYSIRTRLHPVLPLRMVEVVVAQAQPQPTVSERSWFRSAPVKHTNEPGTREVRLFRYIAASEPGLETGPQMGKSTNGSVSQ